MLSHAITTNLYNCQVMPFPEYFHLYVPALKALKVNH